jgi:hypothetical protein
MKLTYDDVFNGDCELHVIDTRSKYKLSLMPSPFLKDGKLDENSIHNIPIFIGVDDVDAEEEFEKIKMYLSRENVKRLITYLIMLLKKTNISEELEYCCPVEEEEHDKAQPAAKYEGTSEVKVSIPVLDEEDSKSNGDAIANRVLEFSDKVLDAVISITGMVEDFINDTKNLKGNSLE